MADASDSKSDEVPLVWVQVPSPASLLKAVNTVKILYLPYFFIFGVFQNVCKKCLHFFTRKMGLEI